MSIRPFALFLLLSLMTWAKPVFAAQSYDNCTGFVSSLPAVITTQGTWCLKQDLTTAVSSGNAISINANNVTLDCNDFKVGGLAAGLATTATGIYSFGHVNATVRHCNIRGFAYGLFLSGNGSNSSGHLVEDNRFDGNTFTAMRVEGDGSVVQRNRVFDTGGGTALSSYGMGIDVFYSVDVLDNIVSGVTAVSGSNNNAWGIYTYQNLNGRVAGNAVRGLVKDGTGFAYGLFNYGNSRVVMHDNDLVGDGTANTRGIYCDFAAGIARDNVISGFPTAILTCTDAGGNYVSP